MTMKLAAALIVLTLAVTRQSSEGRPLLRAVAPGTDTVHVAAPAGERGAVTDNLIEGNVIIGTEGLGIEIRHASRNRIVNNTVTRVERREPFPGNAIAALPILGGDPETWRDANGSGIWLSLGSDENERMNRLADRYVEAVLERHPEDAYHTGLPALTHARLTDNSLAALEVWQEREDAFYAELMDIDPARLHPQELTAWSTTREKLESARGMRICRRELWQGVNAMYGWHLDMAFLASRQPVATAEERRDALQRWSSLLAYVDTEIDNLRAGLRQGYSAARPVAAAMLQQIEALLESQAENWPLFDMAARAEDENFSIALARVIDTGIRPAVLRYRDFLADEYVSVAREGLAIAALPNGAACYEAKLRHYSTLQRDADAVYELGLRTVAASAERAVDLADSLFGWSDVATIVDQVRTAPDNRFESADHLLEHSRRIVDVSREKVSEFFVALPNSPIVVEPVPEFRDGAPLYYYEEPGSAGEPGAYRISLDFWETWTVGDAEIAAVHEVWPGHHLEAATTIGNAGNHPITKLAINAGFAEGWAIYAEHLAEEANVYTVEYARITGRLRDGVALAVDAGIHAFDWTEEQAVAFLMEPGFSKEAAHQLVLRHAAWPGQAIAYDTGALLILELRREAEDAMGDRFDIREFHQRVLENGMVPLWHLQNHVRAWIQAESR